ncbi:hypothetical protein LTR49_016715 [Elasticomyces elasticus]|nr:hypothetical protein LTR49_016715 [Elasticomyces elasticus]
MPDSPAMHISVKGHGLDKYPAKSHARRVTEKLEVAEGLLVLAATPSVLYPNSDQPQPFRQDRYFYYLSGCNESGCYVAYDIHQDKLVLWLPEIDKRKVVWSGRGSTVEEALEKYDIDDAKYISSSDGPIERGMGRRTTLEEDIQQTISLGISIYSLPDSLPDSLIGDWLYIARGGESQLQYALNCCRVIKDEHEISLIRRANEITAEAHKAVLCGIHGFTNEADVEAAYMGICIARHAREQAYSPIAGSGSNASELHYVKNEDDFGHSQIMVLDAGCEYSCYASDVTRTIPLNRRHPGTWPSEEAKNVYKLVERVQEACIVEMRPGKSFVEITRLSFDMVLDGLLELGVLKGEREEVKEAGTHYGFFPHGLGHHLGLEVHDVAPQAPPQSDGQSRYGRNGKREEERGREGYLRSHPHLPALPANFDFAITTFPANDGAPYADADYPDYSVLQSGMVVTIEPGVYFNAYLLDNFFLHSDKHTKFIDKEVLKRYMPVGGVRIEDDILVTKKGYENLTSAAKGDEMLKIIRESAVGSQEA